MITFETTGKVNTDATIRAALDYAESHGIRSIVVASCRGETAKKLQGCGKNVTVVTHMAGFKERGFQPFPEDLRRELVDSGMNVLTTTHVLAGVDRAINYKFGGMYPAELIAHTLRILGQGFKVAIEVAVMAMDAGYIGPEEDIIAIGGSGSGADTAVVLRPGHSHYFFDTDVKEIICMPYGHRKNG